MRQSFRPYTMVAHNATAGASKKTVTLKDTSGNDFYANYISVAVSADTDPANSSMYRCSVDLPGTFVLEAAYDTPIDMIDDTASGVPGVYFSPSFPGELLLSDNDRVNKVNLECFESAATLATYFITYGQVSVGNNIRDQNRPVGS